MKKFDLTLSQINSIVGPKQSTYPQYLSLVKVGVSHYYSGDIYVEDPKTLKKYIKSIKGVIDKLNR